MNGKGLSVILFLGLILVLSLFVSDLHKFYSLSGTDNVQVKSFIKKCPRFCYLIIETATGDKYQLVADPSLSFTQDDIETLMAQIKPLGRYQVSYVGYTGSGPFGAVFSPSYKIITVLKPVIINSR